MQFNSTPKYYSLDELSIIIGCAKNTLRYDPKFNEMCKGMRVGKRRVVYSMEDVKSYLESNQVK